MEKQSLYYYEDDDPSTFSIQQSGRIRIGGVSGSKYDGGNDDEEILNESRINDEYRGEGESLGTVGSECGPLDDENEEKSISSYGSSENMVELEDDESSGDGSGSFDSKVVCQNVRDPQACQDAVFSAHYEKALDKEDAFRKLVTRAFLIPIHKSGQKEDQVLNAVVPTEKFLVERLKDLVGKTRVQRSEKVRKAQETLRDYYGSTVSVETMKKLEMIKEKHRQAKLKVNTVEPLIIPRNANKKGYLAPRVPIKAPRIEKRANDAGPIPEADLNRMKNTMWRVAADNYEMVYPVECEMRRKQKFLTAIEKTHLGPGSYYVDEYYDIQKKKKLQLGKGYLNKQSQRFSNKVPMIQPPSATAYGNPYDKYEKGRPYKTGGTKTLFESLQPFKTPLPENSPSPGNYNPMQSSVDQLLLSRKGVYYPERVEDKVKLHRNKDPRGLIKYGSQANKEKVCPESKFTPKSFVDFITDPRHRLLGVFSKVERDAYDGGIQSVRQPRLEYAKDMPGPGSYSLSSSLKVVSKSPAAKIEEEKICCSIKESYEDPVSPVYYDQKRGFKYLYKNIKGNGAQSAFNSESSRGIKRERMLFLAERSRGLNIPLDEKELD